MIGLLPREAALLGVLESNEDRWGEIRLTMEELSELTDMSRSTLWRALVALKEKGYVAVTRTKRNLGRLYKNVYKILNRETSTAGQGNSLTTLTDLTTVTTKVNNTSYCLGRDAPEEGKMVNKWSSEDDGLVGFGLIDSYVPVEKVKKVPKTRHLRPQSEWTHMDVASEFTTRIYDKVRGIPGMVNTRDLAIALAANRKKFGITAEQEMKIMDQFFTNEQNLLAIKKFPKRTQGIFLNFITRTIADISNSVTIEQAVEMADQLEYLVASDGKKFVKSASGRQELKEYEEELLG